MNMESAKWERKTFLDMSMKLIGTGRLHTTSMDEIGHLALLSSNTVNHIFCSREIFISELVKTVTREIEDVILGVTHQPSSFKDRFFILWFALFYYYIAHPDVIAMLEQWEYIAKENKTPVKAFDALTKFFSTDEARSTSVDLGAGTLAYIFHENILTAARMKKNTLFTPYPADFEQLPTLLWRSIAK